MTFSEVCIIIAITLVGSVHVDVPSYVFSFRNLVQPEPPEPTTVTSMPGVVMLPSGPEPTTLATDPVPGGVMLPSSPEPTTAASEYAPGIVIKKIHNHIHINGI